MTNFEINKLLEGLSGLNFLEAIQEVHNQEDSYKKSAFFKATKIPLKVLFKEYMMWGQVKKDLIEELDIYIRNFDVSSVIEKIHEIFDKVLNDPEFMEKIKEKLKDYDSEGLNVYMDKIEGELNKFKDFK